MKRFSSLFLLVIATLFVAQPGSAMSQKQTLQIDVLVLDATMALANTGAAGGKYAAWQEFPESHNNGPFPDLSNPAIAYALKIEAASERATLSYCPTCDALKWVSKSPWWPPVPFFKNPEGFQVSRNAANHLAQSPHSKTWGPDLLWNITTEAARGAIKQGASEEEIGRAAAQASWVYVLNISSQIGDTVRAKIGTGHLADEFDANQVVTSLKKTMDTDHFKQGLPEAQDFYKSSVSNIEQKIKVQSLID